MNTENFENSKNPRSAKWLQRRWLAAMFASCLAVVSIAGFAHPAGTQETTYVQMGLEDLHKLAYHLIDGAEPSQKAALENLVKTARPELEELSQRALAAKHRKLELLLLENMDAKAVGQASADEIRTADELSHRIDEALVDLAKIMTPKQRAQLRDHINGH